MANSLAPTAKVTAATAAVSLVTLVCALLGWLAGMEVPDAVQGPLTVIATFVAGWLAPMPGTGEHVAP